MLLFNISEVNIVWKFPVVFLPRYLCLFLTICIHSSFCILLFLISLMQIMLKAVLCYWGVGHSSGPHVRYSDFFIPYPDLDNSVELLRYFWLSFGFQFALQNFVFIFCCFYICFSSWRLLCCFCFLQSTLSPARPYLDPQQIELYFSHQLACLFSLLSILPNDHITLRTTNEVTLWLKSG